ncbi:MAG: hypothetical protein ACQCXQ_09865 [Verrucomicrobiales bacterium]|nr:vWA domain-containing protein [Verrucomicrobiota bacterium JB025]
MSIVSQFQSPEVEALLRRQKRRATFTSLMVAVLSVVLLGLVLALFLLPQLVQETPVIVTYESSRLEEAEPETRKVTTQRQSKPSAPSASMAKVITSQSASAVAIPVPDMTTPAPSLEFGQDLDFGEGWADGAAFGGGATFFGQKVAARNIAFVIDYSLSMKGKRDALMRKELKKSLDSLTNGTQFSLIFFAGPVWQAGDTVKTGAKGTKLATVTTDAGGKFVWRSGKPAGKPVQQMQWTETTASAVRDARRLVDKTPLVLGTIWDWPLEMALALDPKPDVIYFMTDGTAGKQSLKTAKSIGSKAKRLNIKINCVALMEPKAREGLNELAKRTDGQFTLVLENGKRQKLR